MFAGMCGLYSLQSSPREVRALFDYREQPNFPPRAHVAPSEPIAIVRHEGRTRQFALVRWGLVPGWSKEIRPGKPLINARAETVLDKPSFRGAMTYRRCLIPADGFYEWSGERGRKQAHIVRRRDDALFAFAGLWEHWMAADGSELETAAIITTAANETLKAIHHRMPVVIGSEDFERWLDCDGVTAKQAARLLKPAAEDFFIAEETVIMRRARKAAAVGAEPDKTENRAEQLKLF